MVVVAADITEQIQASIGDIAKCLGSAVNAALPEYKTLQSGGVKGDLKHIYISFLRIAVLFEDPWFRIELRDDRDLDDLVECFTPWSITAFEQTMIKNNPYPKSRSTGITEDQVELQRLSEAEIYVELLKEYTSQIIDDSGLREALPEINWHYGEYYGPSSIY